jgi:Phage integrase family
VRKLERPSLSDAEPAQSFRFHDLRHTFASMLLMNGADLNTVRRRIDRHSSRITTASKQARSGIDGPGSLPVLLLRDHRSTSETQLPVGS